MKPQDPEALAAHAGLYLVDKPEGATSFAVARRARWLLRIKKTGHAGTLDPFATGLLLICAGREATRHIETLMGGRKTYVARLKLGVETTTLDPEGEIVRERPVPAMDAESLRGCLNAFMGEIMQKPPVYSALKHEGRPLYSYARQGVMIEKPARPVMIYGIRLLAYDPAACTLDISVDSGRGAYIRTLAADIGDALGCGAHLTALRRTAVGPFRVEDAVDGAVLLGEDNCAAMDTLVAARIPTASLVERLNAEHAKSEAA